MLLGGVGASTLEYIAVIAASIVGIASTAGVAFSVGNSRRKDETINVLENLLEAVKAEKDHFQRQAKEELAHMRGRLDALQSDWASSLGASIAEAVVRSLPAALRAIHRDQENHGA
jgi:hypothetical protein